MLGAINSLNDAAEAKNFAEFARLKSNALASSEAARLAAENLFSKAPLPGIGSESWRHLWEAARAYSDHLAYPGRKFPAPIEGERCVLCQQPLRDGARSLQVDFETFVTGATQKAAEQADSKFRDYRRELANRHMPIAEIRKLIAVLKTELNVPEVALELRRSALIAAWRLRSLLAGQVEPQVQASIPTEGLKAIREDIESRATALSSAADSAERQALDLEHKELADRHTLSLIVKDVHAEIARKVRIRALNAAAKTCGPHAKRMITNKNKDLSEKLVTDALRNRFGREVEKLKIGSMPIELRKVRDKEAQSFFKVTVQVSDSPSSRADFGLPIRFAG